MHSPVLKSCLFFVSTLLLWYFPVSAQNDINLPSDSTDLFLFVQREYGPDPVLINGLYPEDYILDAIGHPFFMDTIFYPGHVILHNQKFDHVFLQYNIFDQNIIVSQTGTENGSYQIIPPNAFISEFKIKDKVFRKFCFEGINEDYFQVVYNGEIKCLYSFTKKRYVSYSRSKYSTFTFSKDIRKSYLLKDQKLYEYKKLGSFLQYFPKNVKPGIKAYCEKEKLKLSKASDIEIGKLMQYIENEIRGN
jgi:hypothetical protein